MVSEQFQQSHAPKGNLNIVVLAERATRQKILELCTGSALHRSVVTRANAPFHR